MSAPEYSGPARQAGPDQTRRHSAATGPVPRRPDVARGAVTAADGILLVDKPRGLTSHDVVSGVRRLAATRKVGHAGTLDPMATGLLVLGIGRATRLLTYLVGADKTYEATVRLGQETVTEDAEGELRAARGCRIDDLSGTRLEEALAGLTGPIHQVPSAVSAIKVDGVRAYKRVRRGQDIELEARSVTIHELRLMGEPRRASAVGARTGCRVEVVDLDIAVSCSSGTYVRALARDLGRVLGCGAHLTALRRTGVGPFDVGEARSLTVLSDQVRADAATSRPRGVTTVCLEEVARRCFEWVALSEIEARGLRFGRPLDVAVLQRAQAPTAQSAPVVSKAASVERVVAGFAPEGRIVALLAPTGSRARPVLVLDPA